MTTREISMIAAVARNGVIGADGGIPWHLPGDLPRFKRLTMGGALIMGRKTFDSIGRPLPGRQTIVATRDPEWSHEGATAVPNLQAALAAVEDGRSVHIAGGGEIYRLAMPLATRLEITEVEMEPEGDATFPTIDPQAWAELSRQPHDGFSYVTYARRH